MMVIGDQPADQDMQERMCVGGYLLLSGFYLVQ